MPFNRTLKHSVLKRYYFLTATIKNISLSFLVLVIVMAALQPDSDEHTQLSVSRNDCMVKTLLLDQPTKDLDPFVQLDSDTESKRSKAALAGSCQSVSSFILNTHDLTLPPPAITGRTNDFSTSQYSFLIDDRTSDPPRKLS